MSPRPLHPKAAAILSEGLNEGYEDVLEDHENALEDVLQAVTNVAPSATDSEEKPSVSSSEIPHETQPTHNIDIERAAQNVKKASEEVVVPNTLKEYRRLWNRFKDFCAKMQYCEKAEDVDKLFPRIPADFPTWVAAWIMETCDEIDVATGEARHPGVDRSTYATGQKMRAAISHKFAREYGMGTQQWGENIFYPGTFTGNPSLSVTVSHYMISLRRRKARAGQPVTSAKSINEDTIRKLWEFNMFYTDNRTETVQPISRKEKTETPTLWAGRNVRLMLQLLYLTAMLCLLRSDEVLRIRWSHVVFEPFNSSFRIKITLPFRKTHQTGGIAPFYLYPNHAKPWMCPARAWSHWWTYMHGNGGFAGFVFRRKVGYDRLGEHPEDALSPEAFMESFRLNLLDILINPKPYGTHSFRRGGAQYLANTLRWPLTSICAWGGWTERYDNPGTIFKYLVSWTDTPTVAREDFFNPMRRGVDPCHMCGRTCHCA